MWTAAEQQSGYNFPVGTREQRFYYFSSGVFFDIEVHLEEEFV